MGFITIILRKSKEMIFSQVALNQKWHLSISHAFSERVIRNRVTFPVFPHPFWPEARKATNFLGKSVESSRTYPKQPLDEFGVKI